MHIAFLFLKSVAPHPTPTAFNGKSFSFKVTRERPFDITFHMHDAFRKTEYWYNIMPIQLRIIMSLVISCINKIVIFCLFTKHLCTDSNCYKNSNTLYSLWCFCNAREMCTTYIYNKIIGETWHSKSNVAQ